MSTAPAPAGGQVLSKRNVAVLVLILGIGAGFAVKAVQKVRLAAARSTATCKLKQIGLGNQNFHDNFMRFPGNGAGGTGLADPADPTAATWHYQILPYIEQDTLFRYPRSVNPTSPAVVRTYLCPVRDRVGHVGGRPVADFAVNLIALYGSGVPPTPANKNETLNLAKIKDGSSNTILCGAKSLHPDDHTGGNPAIDDSFLNLSAGGTNRSCARYTVGATTVLEALTAPPGQEYTHPVCVTDRNATPGASSDHFGGPTPDQALFAFLDGHVASLSYKWMEEPLPPHPDFRLEWGTEPNKRRVEAVNQFRAVLTPDGEEVFQFE